MGRWALCPHLVGGLGSSSHPRGAGRSPRPCLPVCAHFLRPQGEMTWPLVASTLSPLWGPHRRVQGQNQQVCCVLGCFRGGTWHLRDGCQYNPQVTPGHRPRHIFLDFPPIHHFLNKCTQAVFSMIPVCDFPELGGGCPRTLFTWC